MGTIDIHGYFGNSPIPGQAANRAQVSDLLKARWVERACLFSAHAISVDPLAGNRMISAITDSSDSLYGVLVAHTNRPEPSIQAIREMMGSRQFVGLALTSAEPDRSISRSSAEDILQAHRRYGKPLFLYAPHFQAVRQIAEIATAYPMLRIVVLGMGGNDWRQAAEVAHRITNLYLETSGVLDCSKIPYAVSQLGAHRILFGSGFPHTDTVAAMGLIEDSGLSEADRKQILSLNAQKLFGWSEAVREEGETS